MRKKIISLILAASCVLPVFGGLQVSAAVAPQDVPYNTSFDTDGDVSQYDGWKAVIPADGGTISIQDNQLKPSGGSNGGVNVYYRWAELDLETISSGTVIFEFDASYGSTVNGGFWKSGDVGLFDMYNEQGQMLAGIWAESRAAVYMNGYLGNVGYASKIQSGTYYTIDGTYHYKVVVDLDNDKWQVYQRAANGNVLQWKIQGGENTGLSPTSDFMFKSGVTNHNISKICFGLRNNCAYDNIKVYQPPVQTGSSYEIYVGDTQQAGVQVSANTPVLTWSSSNTKVATVNANGLITGKKAGTAIISAKNEIYGIDYKYNVKVRGNAKSITIDQKDAIIYTGETFRLSCSPDEAGNDMGTITWSSSDRTIATVDENGYVTGIKQGTTEITAKSQYGAEVSYTLEVVDFDDSNTVCEISNNGFDNVLSGFKGWIPNTYTDGVAPERVLGGVNSSYGCAKLAGNSYLQHWIDGMEPGNTYTISFWMKVVSLNEGVTAGIQIGYEGWHYTIINGYVETTDGWVQKRLELTLPRNATRASILFYLSGTGEVYFDDLRITNQKDKTHISLYSDGLKLNSFVEDAPLLNANVHYVPKTNENTKLITSIYENGKLQELASRSMTNTDVVSSQIADLVDVAKLKDGSSVAIFNWKSKEGQEPVNKKAELFGENKTKRSDVFDFFTKERMRGIYGDVYDWRDEADIKALIEDKSINTYIFNIISTHYGGNICKDMTALNKVLDDLEAFEKESGVKVFPKISFGANATVLNTAYGAFHPGSEHTRTQPCPRSRQYWKAQVTDVLSNVARHTGITGAIIDLEMYSGGATSYGRPCFCDTCAADFDAVNYTSVANVTANERYKYVLDNRLYSKYSEWHKKEITQITSEVREALHEINPDMIIGYMPGIEWIAGITEGLGTEIMPVVNFSENEYKGRITYMYGVQAMAENRQLPVLHATGLWTNSTQAIKAVNTDDPEAKVFEDYAKEAVENSLGFWIYETSHLVGDVQKTDYIRSLNNVRDYAAQRHGN